MSVILFQCRFSKGLGRVGIEASYLLGNLREVQIEYARNVFTDCVVLIDTVETRSVIAVQNDVH